MIAAPDIERKGNKKVQIMAKSFTNELDSSMMSFSRNFYWHTRLTWHEWTA